MHIFGLPLIQLQTEIAGNEAGESALRTRVSGNTVMKLGGSDREENERQGNIFPYNTW